MSNRTRIYVVDDDASMRRSLTVLLEAHGFRVDTFASAGEFLSFKHAGGSSCCLLDVFLPDMNGPTLQEAMSARGLAIPIVFITGQGDIPMVVKAMKEGAVDFLPKPFTEAEILGALGRAIVKSKAQNTAAARTAQIQRRIQTLSPMELEIFKLVATGLMSKQVASRRGVSLQTIKIQRSNVMRKMQAKTVTELIEFARQTGHIPS